MTPELCFCLHFQLHHISREKSLPGTQRLLQTLVICRALNTPSNAVNSTRNLGLLTGLLSSVTLHGRARHTGAVDCTMKTTVEQNLSLPCIISGR